jgi:hypothetical protein
MGRTGSGMAKRVVKRLVISAAVVLAVVELAPARAQQALVSMTPNNTPLAFGMDAQQVSLALGTPLNYVSGRRGNEMYLALPNVKGAALSYRNDGLYLQFRRGKLEGWKGDWRANRPYPW